MNGTTVVCAMLVLVGARVHVKAAGPSAGSEMNDMRFVEGGTLEMGDAFDGGLQDPRHGVLGYSQDYDER